MNEIPSYLATLTPWEFSVYIAPRDMIRAALPGAATVFRSVTYLHGGTGTRLLPENPDRGIRYVPACRFEDLIFRITQGKGDLLLIEYHDEWYSDDPDRIATFGSACKEYTRKKGAVVLLSVRNNYVIRSLQPFIGPVQWVQTSGRYTISQQPLLVNEEQEIIRYGQQTLIL